jgi:biotin operon repressor
MSESLGLTIKAIEKQIKTLKEKQYNRKNRN